MTWPRTAHRPSGRVARLAFVALTDGGNVDDALDRARDRAGADWEALTVEQRSRSSDGGWLDEALAGRAAVALAERPAHEQAAAARGRFYLEIAAEVHDPPTAAVLRAALHVLESLAAEGDLVLALDRATARWWSPDDLACLPADRGFELDEHVQVVVEAVERRPGVGHIVRSRGLGKLARPDVCARSPRRDADHLAELVRDLARAFADGEMYLPGEPLRARDAGELTLVPRSDDALADAPADTAPLYEVRDLLPSGPGPTCDSIVRALRPKVRLKLQR